MKELTTTKRPAPRRLTHYFGKRFVLVLALLFFGIIAMMTVMKIANCYIIAAEAMEIRAEYILSYSQSSRERMEYYFSNEYVEGEELATNRAIFSEFEMSQYSVNPKVTWLWVWPWSNTCKVRVHDEVRYMLGSQIKVDDTVEDKDLPRWPSGTYVLTLKNNGDGAWLIVDIEVVSLDPVPTPSPTPVPTPTPTPDASGEPGE